MLWSRSLTNLLFLVLSESFLCSAPALESTVVMAGDRLPALAAGPVSWLGPGAPVTCLGLTGEGVARSRGTRGGGTSSDTCPARHEPGPRGRGREEGRVREAGLTRGLSGITGDHWHTGHTGQTGLTRLTGLTASFILIATGRRERERCNHNIFSCLF